MTKGKAAKLPKKLSDLIELAVNDVKAVSRKKKYVLDLDVWHEPEFNTDIDTGVDDFERCCVCFAGSVIANTLKKPMDEVFEPCILSGTDERAMYALNAVRVGLMSSALSWVEAPSSKIKRYTKKYGCQESFHYEGSDLQFKEKRKQFYKDMARVVKQLREVGL